MNSLKRLFISLKSQVDVIVDDFENHEAVAGVAIKDLEEWRGKTRIHQHRLQTMVGQFEATLAELHKEAETWAARAVKTQATDQQKALECVKRMVSTQQQIKTLEAQLQTAQSQHAQLAADLNAVQTRLYTLTTQKAVFAARQNRLHLQASLKNGDGNPLAEAQRVFNRWEEAITGAECGHPDPISQDPFADAFAQAEETLELNRILAELAAKTTPSAPKAATGQEH